MALRAVRAGEAHLRKRTASARGRRRRPLRRPHPASPRRRRQTRRRNPTGSLSSPAPIPPADADLTSQHLDSKLPRIIRDTESYRQFFPASARYFIRISTEFDDRIFFRNKSLQILARVITLTIVNFGVILAPSEYCKW